MRVTNVGIEGFRNLRDVRIETHADVNLILGENAQGKTNILEAVFVAFAGTSFRLSSERALVGAEETVARVEVGLVTDDSRSRNFTATWQVTSAGVSKAIKTNGAAVSVGELLKTTAGIIFAPEDIDLVRLSPQYRRRFIDQFIARLDPGYASLMGQYVKILRQRNQLLLMVKQGRAEDAELDVWDEKLSETGAEIVGIRRQYLTQVTEQLQALYGRMFDGDGAKPLVLAYAPSIDEDKMTFFRERLSQYRNLDLARVTTSHGIHRDDLKFFLGGLDVRLTASRGEFRSILLALKLAEASLLRDKLGEKPVYFLDDIFSELDQARRQAVIREIDGAQIWLTTSDETLPGLFNNPNVIRISEGRVMQYV